MKNKFLKPLSLFLLLAIGALDSFAQDNLVGAAVPVKPSTELVGHGEIVPPLLGYVRINKTKQVLDSLGFPTNHPLMPLEGMVLFVWEAAEPSGAFPHERSIASFPMALFMMGSPQSEALQGIKKWAEQAIANQGILFVPEEIRPGSPGGAYLLWGGAKPHWLMGHVAGYVHAMLGVGTKPLFGEHCQNTEVGACVFLENKTLPRGAISGVKDFLGLLLPENVFPEASDFLEKSSTGEIHFSFSADHLEMTWALHQNVAPTAGGNERKEKQDLAAFLPSGLPMRFQIQPLAGEGEPKMLWDLLFKKMRSHCSEAGAKKFDGLWEQIIRYGEGMGWAGTVSVGSPMESELLLVLAPVWHPDPVVITKGEEEGSWNSKIEYIPPNAAAKKMLGLLYDTLDELANPENRREGSNWSITDVRRRKGEVSATWNRAEHKISIEAGVAAEYVVLRVGGDSSHYEEVIKAIKTKKRDSSWHLTDALSRNAFAQGEIDLQALARANPGRLRTETKDAVLTLPHRTTILSWMIEEGHPTQMMRVRIPRGLLAAWKPLQPFIPATVLVPSSAKE